MCVSHGEEWCLTCWLHDKLASTTAERDTARADLAEAVALLRRVDAEPDARIPRATIAAFLAKHPAGA